MGLELKAQPRLSQAVQAASTWPLKLMSQAQRPACTCLMSSCHVGKQEVEAEAKQSIAELFLASTLQAAHQTKTDAASPLRFSLHTLLPA